MGDVKSFSGIFTSTGISKRLKMAYDAKRPLPCRTFKDAAMDAENVYETREGIS